MVSGKDPKKKSVVSGRALSCKNLFLVFTFLSLTTYNLPLIHAADANVTAEARVRKSRVRIGDEIRLAILVEYPRKYALMPPSGKTPVAPFEIKKIDSQPLRKGQTRVQETFTLILTVFQIGDLTIPAIGLDYTDDHGNPGQVSTGPVSVKVLSVGKKLIDKDDIRPIKSQVSMGLRYFWSWVMGLIALVLFLLVTAMIVRRKIREYKDAESRKPPHERVKIEIVRLKDHGYLEEKNYKAFYSELSDILRRYLERRFGLEALESTTAELLAELDRRSFEKSVRDGIRDVLTESDLIKFAKLAPTYELAGRLETAILEVAENTKPRLEAKK